MSGTFGGLHDLLKQITTFLSTSLLSLWNTFLAPLGMALIHLFIGIMKGVWHGPFFRHLRPHTRWRSRRPRGKKITTLTHFQNPGNLRSFCPRRGYSFRAGVGFRMYTQMLLFVMRASWFGAIPEYLNTQDGLWSKLPDPVYKTVMARIVGAVIGMVVGFRFFANALVLMAKGFFFGFDPIMMHCADGMLFKLNGGFPKSFIGKAFGLLFGFGIGFYPFINFLTVALRGLWFGIYPEIFVKDQHLLPIGAQAAYSTVAGRIVGGVAGGFLGLFGLVNTIFLILWGFFYGAVGDYHLKGGVLGKPVYPLKSVVGRAFGCIFGLYFGFRTFLDVSLTFILHFWKYMSMLWEAISKVLGFIYRVILRNLGRIFKFIGYGIWYGYAPMKCHLQDGLLPSLSEKDCDIAQSNVDKTCMSIGAFLGMGVGLRAKCNFITMIPRASWHGPLSPDLIIDDGFPCLTFPKKPLKTVVGKVFGVVFGLGLGFRSYTKVLGILMRGGWYGAFPRN
ncbi:hypothetical protein BC829DRAFT_250144 [Chytridium lagenaria]|nr:hypothetical protein BC829DRAFT_250144 [Chytridium lagenaria]